MASIHKSPRPSYFDKKFKTYESFDNIISPRHYYRPHKKTNKRIRSKTYRY